MDVQIESVWICTQAGHGSAHANTRAALRRLCTAAICADNRWLPTSAGGKHLQSRSGDVERARETQQPRRERGGGERTGGGALEERR